MAERVRREIKITGIVQGVGFRPFVYRLATSLGLKGYCLNSSEGVIIDVEGEIQKLEEFISLLKSKAPPLSKIENILITEGFNLCGYNSFDVRESLPDGKFALISPDIAVCPDCLSEMLNPSDRRYRYPFINCTNCGPRYSIVSDIPYDRSKTTMSKFKMCNECEKEYHDPSNRRFHAQPNACPKCGPKIQLQVTSCKLQVNERDPVKSAVELLKHGAIGVIKGLGGFHIACDASNDNAVRRLREKKKRSNKPFAIMCSDMDTVGKICEVSDRSRKLLNGELKPIVLLPKLTGISVSKYIAPDNNYLGVMLPYTPLHYLLLHSEPRILVMTSGNLSDEPIVIDNDEAIDRLSNISDFFLLHDRDIYMRVDDSIVRGHKKTKGVIRRSRGYVPNPIDLGIEMPEILGCGGELKNTFTLTKGHYAVISQHIGDLENYEAAQFYKETLKNLKNSFRVEPAIIAHDLHPDYWTTKFSKELIAHRQSLVTIPIQHHHAHIASCMAENHIKEKVIGVAWDGTGYGTDGAIWGGEFLIADYNGFERAGYFRYVPLPGGDKAVKEPYRMALSHLYDAYGIDFLKMDMPFLQPSAIGLRRIKNILKMIDNRLNTVMTSSAGRLFDAVSFLLNGIDKVTYEGEAAVRLEMMADKSVKDSYSYQPSVVSHRPLIIDTRILIEQIVTDLLNGVDPPAVSAKFHNTLSDIIVEMCRKINSDTGIDKVVLSGGCFQNIFLLDRTLDKLSPEFETFIHNDIPANDGGISLGQAVIAAHLSV